MGGDEESMRLIELFENEQASTFSNYLINLVFTSNKVFITMESKSGAKLRLVGSILMPYSSRKSSLMLSPS
jgi:hypothetical protein